MAYQLSMNTGKRGSRSVRRTATSIGVASLVADDGNTRLDVELRGDGGINIAITRDDTHERRDLYIPGMWADMKADMPTIITIDGQGWRKQGSHIVAKVEYTSGYRTNKECDRQALCGAEYHYRACPSFGRAGSGVKSGN